MCEDAWDSRLFANYGDADQWLFSVSSCGNCNDEGGSSLLAAVEKHDAGQLAELIARSDGSVWLNQDRTAVQARGCGAVGTAGVHIAVDPALFAAVSAALELLDGGGDEARN